MRGFDWEELKTAYNGRSVPSRGLRNSGNETYEPPFRGALVIAQNADVSASNPMLERIIHLYTDRSGQNAQTKAAAEQLIAVNLNHFIQLATERRQQIPPVSDLKRVLKTSRTYKFIEVRTVNSAINAKFNRRYPAAPRRPATVKCCVFQR